MTAGSGSAVPNMARVYDYWLGGKDHYAADRAEAERLLAIYPPLRDLVRENRAFVTEAITWAARQGIGQFIDLGEGLPASPSVHQAARAVLPAARVAYVDIDPVVLSHARALLTIDDCVTAVAADPREPAAVLADPELRAVIDPARPVGIILGAVLHFLDADTAQAVTGGRVLCKRLSDHGERTDYCEQRKVKMEEAVRHWKPEDLLVTLDQEVIDDLTGTYSICCLVYGTISRACSSPPARTSRLFRRVCAMPAPRPRSTPTAISGPTGTSRPTPPSRPSSLPGRNSDEASSQRRRSGPV